MKIGNKTYFAQYCFAVYFLCFKGFQVFVNNRFFPSGGLEGSQNVKGK